MPQYFAYPLAVLGRAAEAREILATMVPDADTDRVSNYLIFETYAALGDFDDAFSWLEQSLESRDFETVQWLHAPRLWGALAGHPRMQKIQDSLRALEGAHTRDDLVQASPNVRFGPRSQ